jgi:hypothetical protein
VGAQVARHHSSHRRLLTKVRVDRAAPAELEAIVVPSFRRAGRLRHVMRVARHLHTQLVVLCSGRTQAAEVIGQAADIGTRAWAIDLPAERPEFIDAFETTRIQREMLGADQRDIAMKRNLGLLLGRSLGWQRIMFIDDDIKITNADQLRRAAALSDRYEVVGLENHGYPDNSVVCHANRIVGRKQKTFVGGGAMVVQPHRVGSFFPEIYNEDWLFMLAGDHLVSVAAAGRVIQGAYDPFADPNRARREEFGDCIAEGLFSRLDHRKPIEGADKDFWTEFLADRRLLIQRIRRKVRSRITGDRRERMLAALAASERSRASISPADCVVYLQAWERDRALWRTRLTECPTTDSIYEAVQKFGISAADVHEVEDRQSSDDRVPRP